jgi:hypothetical protein
MLSVLLTGAGPAFAADYYFDSVGGDDGSDGRTEATAKKTFKMPSGSGNTVYLKRGSSFAGNLSASNVTVKAYGTGNRPEFLGTLSLTKATVEGVAARPPADPSVTRAVNVINVMGDSTLVDCEADGGGTSDHVINVGIGVMGTNNRILGNYVHDLAWSQSGGQMDNSGGAEGIMVMASNNEIAWNSAVRCLSVNATLGGMEGGCFEIVNGKALSTISNVSFHHNYCEDSVGMWEGCSGDFSATGGDIQANHGIIENVTISYNVSVDSMWLFLLQPVNTDFKNVVFANNTLIHTAHSAAIYDKSPFHYSMGNAVATYTNSAAGKTYDTDNEFYKKGVGFQLGTIIVKNNIFIDDVGTTRYSMFSTSFLDHSNNIFVPANASIGSITVDATEKKLNLADLGLSDVYKLTAKSTAAIDQGVLVNMTTNAQVATKPADPSFFPSVFTQDYDKQPVPCGAGVDVGASEYCEGGATATGGTSGGGGSVSRPTGTGGVNGPGSGGSIGTGSGPKGTGGSAGSGGLLASGGAMSPGGQGGGGVLGKGGAASEGGAVSSGGVSGAGGGDGSSSDSVASGGASGSTAPRGASNGGCSCGLGAGRNAAFPGAGSLLLLAFGSLVLRRRRIR